MTNAKTQEGDRGPTVTSKERIPILGQARLALPILLRTLFRKEGSSRKPMSWDLKSYMFLVAGGLVISLASPAAGMFVCIGYASLLMLWHMRHDPTGELTYARYRGATG